VLLRWLQVRIAFLVVLKALIRKGFLPPATVVCEYARALGYSVAMPGSDIERFATLIPGTERFIPTGPLGDLPSADVARVLVLSISQQVGTQSIELVALVRALSSEWRIECDEEDLKAEFGSVDLGDEDHLPCRRSCAIAAGRTGDVVERDAAALQAGLAPKDADADLQGAEGEGAAWAHVGEETIGNGVMKFMDIPGAPTMAYPHLFITGAGDYTLIRILRYQAVSKDGWVI